ncbi:MAG: hypothetical protein ACUVXA_17045 [Candidatus Jordarchaeum sp.]|uniref:hypothetical protein n=1 Tax=Candidatus Jordarchaeum sp. TaxID=2823881 RepID=UPI00404B541C
MDNKSGESMDSRRGKKQPLWEKIVELWSSPHKAQAPEAWPIPSGVNKAEIILSRNPMNWYAFCADCRGYIANVEPHQNGEVFECPCCGCEAQLDFSEALKQF